ncbi:hypothetical protein HGRIS_003843 [Hohenbuehelia grisea]|uniref:Uncharacterized protein n=1 Tax=Hohenbuehelia grisea TaxID=104357 RepID=A0ABR3JIA5_9AGAR
MLLRNQTNGLPFPAPQDIHAETLDDSMYHYLFQKLDSALEMVNRFIAKRTEWSEASDGSTLAYSLGPEVRLNSEFSRFGQAFFALCAIQALSSDPKTTVSMQFIGELLFDLANHFRVLCCESDAALCATAAAEIYSRLYSSTRSNDFLGLLAASLDRLTSNTKDREKALATGGEAVTAWVELNRPSCRDQDAIGLAHSLVRNSDRLSSVGRFDEALESSCQGFYLIRNTGMSMESRSFLWQGFGEATVGLTTPPKPDRLLGIADIEVTVLYSYARNLAACGQYNHAFATGLEAIGSYEALVRTMPLCCRAAGWNRRLHRLRRKMPSWVPLTRQPSQRFLLAFGPRQQNEPNEESPETSATILP